MMKSKPKLSSRKNCTQTDPDFDDCVQDGWVVVKKQKVTIFIPSLPLTEPCAIPSITTKEVDHITPLEPDPPVTMPLVTTEHITTCLNPPKLNNKPKPRNPLNREPRCNKTVKIYGAPKARKLCGNLLNGHMLVNQKMRALNLERKIERAGGLNRWLVSIGLAQFVKIFRRKRVGKMQLVNLTMKKLKDMGADAVGPRRKLMHAIDCIW